MCLLIIIIDDLMLAFIVPEGVAYDLWIDQQANELENGSMFQ
jgi:hypothetical protein